MKIFLFVIFSFCFFITSSFSQTEDEEWSDLDYHLKSTMLLTDYPRDGITLKSKIEELIDSLEQKMVEECGGGYKTVQIDSSPISKKIVEEKTEKKVKNLKLSHNEKNLCLQKILTLKKRSTLALFHLFELELLQSHQQQKAELKRLKDINMMSIENEMKKRQGLN